MASLINIGELSQPATVLVERISDAVGGIAKPWQMKRVAKAEIEIDRLKAVAALELTEIQERGLARLIGDAEQKQRNIEAVTAKAIPYLAANANPSAIDKDWLVSMFDKAQMVSGEELQELWARILGEEANAPGTFSRRTLEIINSLDAADASAFEKLCSAIWSWGAPTLILNDLNELPVPGLRFDDILSLEALGLLSTGLGYSLTGIDVRNGIVQYCGVKVSIVFAKENGNEFPVGVAILTKAGAQLATIVTPEPSIKAFDMGLKLWFDAGCTVAIDIADSRLDWLRQQASSKSM